MHLYFCLKGMLQLLFLQCFAISVHIRCHFKSKCNNLNRNLKYNVQWIRKLYLKRQVYHNIYHLFSKRDLCDVCTFWKPYVFNVLLIQWWVVDAVACCGCFDVLVICAKYHILIRCLPSYYWVEKYMRYRCYDSVYSTMKIKKKFSFSQILA